MTTITVSEDIWRELINERLSEIEKYARHIAINLKDVNEYIDSKLKPTEHSHTMINVYINLISSDQRTIVNQVDALRKMLDGSSMESDG